MVKKVNKKVLKASLIGLALVVVVGLAIWLIVSKQITVTFGKNQATSKWII